MSAQPSTFPNIPVRDNTFHIPTDAQSMLTGLACDFAVPGTALYEIGHTLPELLPALHDRLDPLVELVSIDESARRLQAARCAVGREPRPMRFLNSQIDDALPIKNASVVIMAGASRHVHPLHRTPLLASVHQGLQAGGCVLIMEMTRSRESLLNNLYALHSRHTGNAAYATDSIQMASTLDEERERLRRCGFRSTDVFYQHYALSGLIAIK